MQLAQLFAEFAAVPLADREILAAHVLGVSRAAVVARPQQLLSAAVAEALRQLLARAATGEPVAYLVGTQFFYGRPFAVTPAVLIPRPATELLVELALAAVQSRAAPRILEIGTGSGCVAISLALAQPAATVWATDLSPAALAVARQNAAQLGARVHFLASDLLAAVPAEAWDVVVSNPPYVGRCDRELQPAVRQHEPTLALFGGGADGLDLPRRLLRQLAQRPTSGQILVELAPWQLPKMAELAHQLWPTAAVATHADLAGQPRVLAVRQAV